jgi:hypothetical protein
MSADLGAVLRIGAFVLTSKAGRGDGVQARALVNCAKSMWRANELDASTLCHCRSLREVDLCGSDVPEAVLAALADVSTLETLRLCGCLLLRDVRALARSVSLRKLDLSDSTVRNTGIAGLERVPSLTWLSMASCEFITNVTNLFRSTSLRRLLLSESSVTDAGLVGIELAPALEFVHLRRCVGVTAATSVALRAAERSVKVIL